MAQSQGNLLLLGGSARSDRGTGCVLHVLSWVWVGPSVSLPRPEPHCRAHSSQDAQRSVLPKLLHTAGFQGST